MEVVEEEGEVPTPVKRTTSKDPPPPEFKKGKKKN